MIIPIIVFVSIFAFFGWLIANSKEAKTGTTRKTKKQLKWLFLTAAVGIICAIVILPVLEEKERVSSRIIEAKLLEKYGSEIFKIDYLYSIEGPRVLLIGDSKGSSEGKYRYEVFDQKGNRWDWDILWREANGEISILNVRKH